MNRSQMIRTSAMRPLHIRCRLQQRGKGQLVKGKLRSTFCTLNPKTFRSRSLRIGSKKSAIRVTNGTLKTKADDGRRHPDCRAFKIRQYPTGYSEEELRSVVYDISSRNINTFSITPITMRRQVRRWQPQGKHNYDVVNIKDDPTREVQSPWVEGVEGDGIGESITLNVKRPLPLYGILIQPGYYDYDTRTVAEKQSRCSARNLAE